MIITLLGRPFVGKTTISQLVGSIFGGETISYIMPVKTKNGEVIDHHTAITSCQFEKQRFSLECIHGQGFMIEASKMLLARGNLFIGVLAPHLINEVHFEFWTRMQPFINPEKLYFIINKLDVQLVKSPKDVLNSCGIYIERPTIEISATSQYSVKPLRNLIVSCLREHIDKTLQTV